MASVAEKAESTGSLEDFDSKEFDLIAVECSKTPDVTPTSKDAPSLRPAPTAKC